MNRMTPSKNITSTPFFWNLPQGTFGATHSLDVISCLRSSFLNYNGRRIVVLKEPIIFAECHPHRRLPIGRSFLHLTFSCLLYIYLYTMSLKTNIRLFLALQEGLHFAISPANMSHQDYSTDSSGKFSFDSCLLIGDVNTVRILNTILILYIYIYRHWVRAFFWQWLFFWRLRLFDRFSRLISSRQYFNSNLQSRTCANSFRDATLPGGSHSSRICPASSVSSDKTSSRQVVATSSTRDSWPSAWMDADALVRDSSSLWSDFILFSSIFLFNISGLERFWQSAFAWFFRPFLAEHGHLWTLEPTELPPLSVDWPWHSTTHLAKVRFQCQVISLAFSYSSSDFHFLV